MTPSIASKLLLIGLSISLIGCDPKKTPQAKESESSPPVSKADTNPKFSTALDKNEKTKTPANKDKPSAKESSTDETKQEDIKPKQEETKEQPKALLPPGLNNANPLLNNSVLKATFKAYLGTGIDDAGFDSMVLSDKLALPSLTDEEQKAVFESYLHVIETQPNTADDIKDTDLSKTLPVPTRMKDVFDFYKNYPVFAAKLADIVNNEPVVKILSDDEKKFATPFIYLSMIFGQSLKNGNDFYGFNVSETTNPDHKKFHTMILGRVEWYKGSKKTVLTKADQSNLDFIRDMTNAWLSSDFKPATQLTLRVVGNAEKDKNEPANVAASKKRAQMVNDYMKTTTPPFMGTYTVDGAGSAAILKDNPKDVKNRRVDIIISETEETAAAPTNSSIEIIDGK